MNTINVLVCLLLLFYTVESLHKERSRGMHDIFRTAPVGTGAILMGKSAGNIVLAVFMLGVMFVCDAVMLIVRGASGSAADFELLPFAATWGLVLVPTFIFWTALVTLIYCLLRSRYMAYAAGIAVFYLTGAGVGAGGLPFWATNWIGAGIRLCGATWAPSRSTAPPSSSTASSFSASFPSSMRWQSGSTRDATSTRCTG